MQSTFVLVHGAFGRPEALTPTIPFLEALGHKATAVDLPCEDPAADLTSYAAAVVDVLRSIDGRRVLVGHSAGGATAVLAATQIHVDALVLVTALVPQPGRSMFEVAGEEMASALESISIDHGDGTRSMNFEMISSMVPIDQRGAVLQHLRSTTRRQGWLPLSQPWPGSQLPKKSTTYVVCTEDNTVPPELQRTFAAAIGVDPIEIASDHDVFALKPQELANLLNDV